MHSLTRDVLFPAAAAIGLLAALIIGTARAQDQPSEIEPVTVAASALAPAGGARAATRSRTAAPAPADAEQPSTIERRCERIDRIGKFRITRCD